MNFQFKIGAFLGSLLLIQLEFMASVLLIIFFGFIGTETEIDFIKTLGMVLAIASLLIFIIGHTKTSVAMYRDFIDPTAIEKEPDSPKNLSEALDLTKNPVTYGVVWRFKQELKFIKEVANLEFKYKE